MKRILVIGASGQIGKRLYKLKWENYEVFGTYCKNKTGNLIYLDITNKRDVSSIFSKIKPNIAILTSSLTNVNRCESEKKLARKINVVGVKNIVETARKYNTKIVFFSTDYIFSGKNGPYLEEDRPKPINYYGKTKLLGEEMVKTLKDYLIIRTTGVFSYDKGTNFALQVLDCLNKNREIRVANDQYANPILADNLVDCVYELILKGRNGIYNISGDTYLSRYEFAILIADVFSLPKGLIIGLSTKELAQRAKRPLRGGLIIEKAKRELETRILKAKDGLILMKSLAKKEILGDIHKGIEDYYSLFHKRQFIPSVSKISIGGRFYNEEEIKAGADAILDFYLTNGERVEMFEKEFAKFIKRKYVILVNSGSSANLLAIASLKLKEGSEVITPASAFPTTINPIIQNNLVPVFVDVELETYNPEPSFLEGAISNKTRAIFITHTLGNPCEMDKIWEIAKKHNLFLIEDCCDALGSKYNGRLVGNFGDLSTFSFYPAHHITMGEGGCVATSEKWLAETIVSLRDWGRACVCQPCILTKNPNATCPKRFETEYDRRYTYINIGYNLKATEPQAAIGLIQLKKCKEFNKIRERNFELLYQGLKEFEDIFILPRSLPLAEPIWFAFPITIRKEVNIERKKIITFLEENKIETRPLFAGNILKQPGYSSIKYRISGSLENSDIIMKNAFFIGLHQGLTEEMINYILDVFRKYRNYS